MAFTLKPALKWPAILFISLLLLPLDSLCQQGDSSSRLLISKADSLRGAARYATSNSYYRKAVEALENERAWRQKAEALYEISLNLSQVDSLEKAERYLEQALSVSRSHFPGDSLFSIKYLRQKGAIAELKAEYREALKYLRQALELASASQKFSSRKVRLTAMMGEVYTAQGNYSEAGRKLARALELYRQEDVRDKRLLSRIYNSYGNTFKNRGEYEKALEYYRRSLELDRGVLPETHPDLAKGYNNIAIVFYYQSDYERALDHMKNATSVLQKFYGRNHRLVAAGYNNIGIVYSEMGELARAADYLKRSLEIKKEILGSSHPDIAIGYQNIGAIYYDMEEYERAIAHYRQAEKLHLKRFPEGHPELANVYANLGQAYARMEEYRKALNYYQKDLEINRQLLDSDHPFIGDTYTKIGETYAMLENYRMARDYYRRAIEIFVSDYSRETRFESVSLENVTYPVKLLETLQLKAEALGKEGERDNDRQALEQALRAYLQGSQLVGNLQRSYSREASKFLLRERTATIYQKGFETAFRLLRETGKEEYREYSLYFAARSQNQVLLEGLRKQNARSFADIPDALIERENTLRNRITELQRQLSSLADSRQSVDSTRHFSLSDSLFHTRRKLEDHIRQLESSYPRYHSLKYRSPVLKSKELQDRLLAPGETMIQYFFGTDQLFAIVLTKENFAIRTLGADSLIRPKIEQYRHKLPETESAAAFAEESMGLYDHLLAPLNELFAGKDLLIIPAGPLHYLPFESLVTSRPGRGESTFSRLSYLMNRYSISYAPSPSYLDLKRRGSAKREDNGGEKFLGFAPGFSDISGDRKRELYPEYDRPILSLPLSKREIREIGELINKDRGFFSFLRPNKEKADLFLEESARESTFKKLPLSSYDYIHLATHAYVSEDQSRQSGILFAPTENGNEDGTLHASEIYTLRLNARLVTLSACRTGTGPLAEGEGIMSLSRAFQYAGARNLLVSLWNVDDRATAELMIAFYRRMVSGESLQKSLSHTKRKMIESRRYAHPKYWAPFILIGN